jgi:catechol 2,3-dioxygenase-like lactoylglutathione lyase family enzyme
VVVSGGPGDLAAPRIAELGHVGIRCNEPEVLVDFYSRVLGLTVTDRDEKLGIWFLSSRPEAEHHELVLAAGRDVPAAGKLIQQISFRCDTLADVIGFYRRLRDAATRFDMIVSHGNAVGVYFFDPEGNRCEIYWQTGLKARQPFVERIDIEMDPELLIDRIRASVERYAKSGLAEPWYVADTLQASSAKEASLRDSGRET